MFSDQVGVTGVFRIDRDRGVTWNRFRAGRRNGQKRPGLFRDLNLEVPEKPLLRFHIDLFVGECGQGGGTPIDHAFAPVDQALAVEFHEDLLDAPGILRVHRESLA